MRTLTIDHLTIQITTLGEGIEIRWLGELAVRNPREVVGSHLDLLKTTLRKQDVCVDFCGFEYMNSASVTIVMDFLRSTTDVAHSVRVRYKPALQWQKTFFGAMRVIAKNWGSIEIQAAD